MIGSAATASPVADRRLPRRRLPVARPLAPVPDLHGRPGRSQLELDHRRALALRDVSQVIRWCGASGAGSPTLRLAVHAVNGLARGVYGHVARAEHLDRLAVSSAALERLARAMRLAHDPPPAVVLAIGPRRHAAACALPALPLVAAATGLVANELPWPWDDDDGLAPLLHVPAGTVVLSLFALGYPASSASPTAPGVPMRRCDPLHIAVDELASLPLYDGAPPGLSALRAAEHVLGLRLAAELPDHLVDVPRTAWRAHGRLRRLREAGLAVRWHWNDVEGDEPFAYECCVSLGGRGRGSGAHAVSAGVALAAAIGEAVERHVALEHDVTEPVEVARVGELNGQALALDTLAGYAPSLRRTNPEQFGWTDDTELAWVPAVSLTGSPTCRVPLQLATRPRKVPPREPELQPHVTTGLAAHPDRDTAILNGLLEVIERDAFMLTWLARVSPPVLDPAFAEDGGVHEMLERIAAARLDATTLLLETDVPVSVVLAVLRDRCGRGPAVSVGAAARVDASSACLAALTEAVAAWRWTRRAMRVSSAPPLNVTQLRRADRLLWWAHRDRLPLIDWLIAGPRVSRPRPSCASPVGLQHLVASLKAGGHDVLVADLTDAGTVQQLGHAVVRVIVPTFHPLYLDEARPALWSQRLAQRLAAVGGSSPTRLNPTPHPFP
jgi:ribosomal protein S12 methylthiotransferase accessory factor